MISKEVDALMDRILALAAWFLFGIGVGMYIMYCGLR